MSKGRLGSVCVGSNQDGHLWGAPIQAWHCSQDDVSSALPKGLWFCGVIEYWFARNLLREATAPRIPITLPYVTVSFYSGGISLISHYYQYFDLNGPSVGPTLLTVQYTPLSMPCVTHTPLWQLNMFSELHVSRGPTCLRKSSCQLMKLLTSRL